MEETNLSAGPGVKPRIPIARPDLSALEQDNVAQAMRSGWITQGVFVRQAQEKLRLLTRRKYAICTSSGTSALIAALLAFREDHKPWNIAAPVLTFAAVHNAIALTGGVHYPIGADEQTWQLPDDWDDRIEDGTIHAIVSAPCYGKVQGTLGSVPNKIRVIEDCAESFGGTFNGAPAGCFGDISCVSFYANKIVTAGEGGALLTDDPILFERLTTLINHGIDNSHYIPRYTGFNGRMTDLQAAILCAQLDRMHSMIERRRSIMAEYQAAAKGEWTLPKVIDGEVCAPWLFAGLPLHGPDYVRRRCREENIECRPFFHVPFSAGSKLSLNVAKRLSLMGLCLPLSSVMTDLEVERVCKVIRGK